MTRDIVFRDNFTSHKKEARMINSGIHVNQVINAVDVIQHVTSS